MANFGAIQIFSNLSNLKTIPDITRFLAAFTSQVTTQFNGLISNRIVSGVIGATGTVLIGSNFGASLVGSGSYWVNFSVPYTQRPAVCVTSEYATFSSVSGVTTTGFSCNAPANTPFSFIARGES